MRDNSSPAKALHVATLAQEVQTWLPLWKNMANGIMQALLLFTVETLRFKSSSVVKANKLGAVRRHFT